MKRSFNRPNSFGAKQPSVAATHAQLAQLICGARDIESLDPVAVARMYRATVKDVEYAIGVERHRRSRP